MGWKRIERGALLNWKEPKVIVGTIMGHEMVEGEYGLKPRYTLETDDGEKVSFFAPTALANQLEDLTIATHVRIEFTGKLLQSKGGRAFKEFFVDVETPDVAGEEDVPF